MQTTSTCAIAALALGMTAGTAHAQSEYPCDTVNFMVGFSAGGNTDILARQVAPYLEKYLGDVDIAVINRPGASGALMYSELANAEADGCTIGLLSLPGVFTVLFGSDDLNYDIDSFEYAGTFTFEPHSLVVGADTPYHSLDEIVQAVKKDPDSVTIGGAGIGSAAHLALKVFEHAADVTFNFIPAPGSAQMRTQVMGGHIGGGVTTVSVSLPMHAEGNGRVLGVMSDERVKLAPDVPTFIEQGYEVEWGALRGIGAPQGTPPEVMQMLSDAVVATFEDPAFNKLAKRDRQLLYYLDGPAFRDAAAKQHQNLKDIWAEEPWRAQ